MASPLSQAIENAKRKVLGAGAKATTRAEEKSREQSAKAQGRQTAARTARSAEKTAEASVLDIALVVTREGTSDQTAPGRALDFAGRTYVGFKVEPVSSIDEAVRKVADALPAGARLGRLIIHTHGDPDNPNILLPGPSSPESSGFQTEASLTREAERLSGGGDAETPLDRIRAATTGRSEIEVKACYVGKWRGLMRAIGALFDGNGTTATIYAPMHTYHIGFEIEDGQRHDWEDFVTSTDNLDPDDGKRIPWDDAKSDSEPFYLRTLNSL